eukprot:m.312368 g.312368  ORF g.312368 m.312368 type:complete len:1248 (+) comp16402_c0_seq3:101-3844(+)
MRKMGTVGGGVLVLMTVIFADGLETLPSPSAVRIAGVRVPPQGVLGIDSPSPLVSWVLDVTSLGQSQSKFHVQVVQWLPEIDKTMTVVSTTRSRLNRRFTPPSATAALIWDSGNVTSEDSHVKVGFGEPLLKPLTSYGVTIKWTDQNGFESDYCPPVNFTTSWFEEVGGGNRQGRKGRASSANAIAATVAMPGTMWLRADVSADQVSQIRSPTFALNSSAPIGSAQLYVATPGYAKCWINGNVVSDIKLGHHTTTEARILYDSFDVTNIVSGFNSNTIACQLGAGWYGIPDGMGHTGARAIRLFLHVVHVDGSRFQFGTTNLSQWMVGPSPYTQAAIFKGIDYDQAMENSLSGWLLPDYPAFAPLWSPGTEFVPASGNELGRLVSALHPPIRNTEPFSNSVTPVDDGSKNKWFINFGQNAAAMLEFNIKLSPTAMAHKILSFSAFSNVECSFILTSSEYATPAGELGPNLRVGPVIYRAPALWLANNTVHFKPEFSYGGFQVALLEFKCNSSTLNHDVRFAKNAEVRGKVDILATELNPVIDTASVVSHFTHTDLDNFSHIQFNIPLLDQVQRMTRYTSFSNLMDHPTDCPTRERAGWTGDGQLTSSVVSYNFDAGLFYKKWLRDIGDSQEFFRVQCMDGVVPPAVNTLCDCSYYNCTGEVPTAAPWYGHGFHGGLYHGEKLPGVDPSWGMAYTVISHHLLDWYGDIDTVEEQYDGLVLYMEYLSNVVGVNPPVPAFKTSGLLTYNIFADWDRPQIDGDTNPPLPPSRIVPFAVKGPRGVPSPLISSWAYIVQLRMMVDIALALGHTSDAQRFQADATRSASIFVEAYFRGNGSDSTFGDGTLTQMSANALALDLFPEDDPDYSSFLTQEQRTAAVSALVRAVISAGNHSDAGIVSARALYPVMSTATSDAESIPAHSDTLALEINLKRDFPSFGNEIAQNATTLWEKFEGTDGTHNHIMFGTQGAWYFEHLAGIQKQRVNRSNPLAPPPNVSAWKNIRFRPTVSCDYLRQDLNLTDVSAEVVTPQGVVSSNWQLWQCPQIPSPPTPPRSSSTCDLENEKDKAQPTASGFVKVGCPAGTVISSVLYADFGTPLGNCTSGFRPGNCSALNATAIVTSLCVGKQDCSVPVSTKTFGDPCIWVPKRLAVKVSCGAHPTPNQPPPQFSPVGPRKFLWSVTVPVASKAVAEMPLLGAHANNITLSANGQTIFRNGAVLQLPPGVASISQQARALLIAIGSGSYQFVLTDSNE